MIYISQIKSNLYLANEISIKELLIKLNEPYRISGKSIRWLKHDSISITDRLWYQHSMQRGGLPVDFLTTFFDYQRNDAINFILESIEVDIKKLTYENDSGLIIPNKDTTNQGVFSYLVNTRFINKEVVDYFIKNGLIYQEKEFKNCVFLGKDKYGAIKHIHKRSTHLSTNDYKGNVSGSNGKYPFNYLGESSKLFVFESPIDLLSYVTLNPDNWMKHNYLALCGLSKKPLFEFLKDHPNIKDIYLCLDNDIAGFKSINEILEILKPESKIKVQIILSRFKDFNEDLKYQNNLPTLAGLSETIIDSINKTKLMISQITKSKRDQNFKDLMNNFSVLYYSFNPNNEFQSEKTKKAFLELASTSLLMIIQQYRHFGSYLTTEYLLKDIKLEPYLITDYQDLKLTLIKLTKEIDFLKTMFISLISHTKEDKQNIISSLTNIYKQCIFNYTILTLKERIQTNE